MNFTDIVLEGSEVDEPNNEPVVSPIALVDVETLLPVEGPCIAGTDYNLAVQKVDPDGDELTIEWVVEGGELTDPYTVPTTWIAPDEPGDYRIDVYVRDGRGAEVNRFIIATVQAP